MAPDACTCDPNHLEVGGYDPGCPRHDPTHRPLLTDGRWNQ